MSDMAGLDVRSHFLDGLKAAGRVPADPRYGALSQALAAAGRLGQKSAAGYYDYAEDGRTPLPSAQVQTIRDSLAERLGVATRAFSEEEIVLRCLLPVINEAAKVLDEGIVRQAGDVDVIWGHGYGFPAAKGGPVFQARVLGLAAVSRALLAHQQADPQFGAAYWAPSPALAHLFD